VTLTNSEPLISELLSVSHAGGAAINTHQNRMRIVHAYTDGDASTAEVKIIDMKLGNSEIIYQFIYIC